MRQYLVPLAVTLAVCGVAARAAVDAEPIPAEFIQQLAPATVDAVKQQFPNPPVKIDAQAEKATGLHVQEMIGAVVLPDRNLTVQAVEGAGEKDVPVGYVATRALNFTDREKGTPIPADRIAMVNFMDVAKFPIFYLAVRGSGPDRTLLVYSKDGKAIASAPLKKQAGDATLPVTLKMSDIDLEKKSLSLTVALHGAYEGTFKLAVQEL